MGDYEFTRNLPEEPTDHVRDEFTDFMRALGENGNVNRQNVIEMLDNGTADINAQNYRGYTAIHLLALRGSVDGYPLLELLEIIYKHSKERIDVDLRNEDGNTPLMTALEIDYIQSYNKEYIINCVYLVKFLKQLKIDTDFNTYLFIGYPLDKEIEMAIEQPVADATKVNLDNQNVWSIIQENYELLEDAGHPLASEAGIKEFTYNVLEYFEPLLASPGDPYYDPNFSYTTFTDATGDVGSELMIATNLENVTKAYLGGRVEKKNELYATIKRLVETSPNINAQAQDGSTAVNLIAKRIGDAKTFKVPSVFEYERISYDSNQLLYLIFRDSTQIIDVNLPDNDGNTPLLSCLNLVEYYKISPEPDIMDLTLLSTLSMVRFLVQYGGAENFKDNKIVQPIADVKHRNNKGHNAFDLVYKIWDKLHYDKKYVSYIKKLIIFLSGGEAPSSVRKMLDYENKPQISSDRKIFDPVSQEEETVEEILSVPDSKTVILTDENLENFAVVDFKRINDITTGGEFYDNDNALDVNKEALNNIVYGCVSETSALNITKDEVRISEPFIQAKSLGLTGTATNSLIRKDYFRAAIYDGMLDSNNPMERVLRLAVSSTDAVGTRVFMIVRDPSMVEISPLADANLINYQGRGYNIANELINVVSGSHCQPGSSGIISYVVPVEVVEEAVQQPTPGEMASQAAIARSERPASSGGTRKHTKRKKTKKKKSRKKNTRKNKKRKKTKRR